MGEIADMMLDGTLCECCGSFIDEDGGDGFPRYCSPQCAEDRGANFDDDEDVVPPKPKAPKVSCPTCKKRVKAAGLAMHQRQVHGVKA